MVFSGFLMISWGFELTHSIFSLLDKKLGDDPELKVWSEQIMWKIITKKIEQ